VRYANAAGAERVVSIVGTDEVDLNRSHTNGTDPDRAGSVLRAHFCGTVP
jgi:hypothetical protein